MVLAGCVLINGPKPRMASIGMPEIMQVFTPVGDVEIHDTWHSSGLCGTGSQDFEADDLFVPAQRVAYLFDLASHRPEPLYQMPLLALFAPQIAAVGLGVASRLTVTIRVGCADSDGGDPESLLSRADAALYQAKTGGRNRVVADPSAPTQA